jgi:voltage-gated potassium channel Kch
MIAGSFVINTIKLFRAIWHGVRDDDEFRGLVFILITLLAGSTYFYWQTEGWSIIDSLYFSVMTMSTIGYGDFAPTTDISKIFTIIFSLLSIGVYVAVVTKIVAIVMADRTASKKRKKLKKLAKTQKSEAVEKQSPSGEKPADDVNTRPGD